MLDESSTDLTTSNSKLCDLVFEAWDHLTCLWKIIFRRNLKDEEFDQFSFMLILLDQIQICHREDIKIWSLDSTGRILTSSHWILRACSWLSLFFTGYLIVLHSFLFLPTPFENLSAQRRTASFSWILIYGGINTSVHL